MCVCSFSPSPLSPPLKLHTFLSSLHSLPLSVLLCSYLSTSLILPFRTFLSPFLPLPPPSLLLPSLPPPPSILHQVGEEGRGVAGISPMLTITRLHNSISATSLMRRIMQLSRDYSTKRVAFGKYLADHPLHMQTLARMEVYTCTCLCLSLSLSLSLSV